MVLIGEFVPRFDLIMGLIGGALTGPLMFIFPPILYARYRHLQGHLQELKKQAPPHYNRRYFLDEQFDAQLDSLDSSETDFEESEVPNYGSIDLGICERHNSFFSRSRSRESRVLSVEYSLQKEPLGILNYFLLISILVLGVLSTCAAVFYSVRGAILYATFSPACFP
jgi:Transmembrane amino acid transporter protein.